MIASTIRRISYWPTCPLAGGCRAFHAEITGERSTPTVLRWCRCSSRAARSPRKRDTDRSRTSPDHDVITASGDDEPEDTPRNATTSGPNPAPTPNWTKAYTPPSEWKFEIEQAILSLGVVSRDATFAPVCPQLPPPPRGQYIPFGKLVRLVGTDPGNARISPNAVRTDSR